MHPIRTTRAFFMEVAEKHAKESNGTVILAGDFNVC